MELTAVTDLVHRLKADTPIPAWQGYSLQDVPFAVYDEQHVNYVGHPNPPASRPDNLMAATSTPINGVETATIPVTMCSDETAAAPLIYHEGFHVFQHHHFAPIPVDTFTAMAYYPDLNFDYRTLCRLEVEVVRHEAWSADQKLRQLGSLIRQRRLKLTHHESLLPYERYIERSEGTAYYVEQKARQALFNIEPVLEGTVGHGWARFYKVGAALCWLLEETTPGWMKAVEDGKSPGDLVAEHGNDSPDLDLLNYEAVRNEESETLRNFRQEIASDLEKLELTDVVHIRYKNAGQTFRAFNPSTLVSLGDGRILHRSFFKLLLPGKGTVDVTGLPVIDHVTNGELILPTTPVHFDSNHLSANTAEVQIDLKNIELLAEGQFAVQAE